MLAGGITACTRSKTDVSSVRIRLPSVVASKSQAQEFSKASKVSGLTADAPKWNSSLNPTALSDINCFAVFVGGPEADLSGNSCSDSSTGTTKMRFGPFRGLVPAGQDISLDVKSGSARQIVLAGFKAQNGACVDVSPGAAGPNGANLSYPHIVAQTTLDLAPGDVNVTLNAALDTSNTFDECNFINNQGSPSLLFGDGRDGSFSISSVVYFNSDGFNHGSLTSCTSGSGGFCGTTKKFAASQRVTNVDNSTGKTLTMDAGFTSDEFQPGDEVLWVVTAAHDMGGAPDSNACGGNLYRGRYGFARISSTNTGSWTISLDSPISQTPGSLNNTNIAQSSISHAQSFCHLTLQRVPNFDTITVPSATTMTLTGLWNMAGSTGIVAFRAKRLVLNAALTVTVDGLGFPGGTVAHGTGVSGSGPVTSSTSAVENAGGYSSSTGGGGGSSAGGGGGAPSGGGGALPIGFCGGSPCAIVRDHKILLGGGGGYGGGAGGAGGGGIFLFVEEISGASPFYLSASGAAGSGGSAGGGAGGGGTIHVTAKKVITTGSPNQLNAYGGTGGTGSGFGGGGGGGGIVEAYYCAAQTTGTSTPLVPGGSGGAASTAGNSGTAGLILMADDPNLCY